MLCDLAGWGCWERRGFLSRSETAVMEAAVMVDGVACGSEKESPPEVCVSEAAVDHRGGPSCSCMEQRGELESCRP